MIKIDPIFSYNCEELSEIAINNNLSFSLVINLKYYHYLENFLNIYHIHNDILYIFYIDHFYL
jgi:hypothetical protein